MRSDKRFERVANNSNEGLSSELINGYRQFHQSKFDNSAEYVRVSEFKCAALPTQWFNLLL